MRRSTPACAALLAAALVTASVRPARAGENDIVKTLVAITVGLAIADIVFAAGDGVIASNGERPGEGYAIAETIVSAPQTAALNPLFVYLADGSRDEPLFPLLLLPTAGATALTTHGIWSLASDDVDPGVLFGVSFAVGANTPLTLNALGAATDGELVGRPVGIAQVFLTTPGVIGGIYGASRDPDHRPGWVALSAWSGALFLHGLASTIWAAPDSPPPLPAEPPPPPLEPLPDQREKPPLLVPASIHFGPGVVTDGVAAVPGIIAGGRF